MNLPPPTGSPIIARIQNEGKFPLIFGIAVIAVLFILGISEAIKQIHSVYAKQSFAERFRTRLTTKADVRAAAKEYSFTQEEAQVLYEACKKHKVPNVRFFLKDYEQTTRLLKAAFLDSLGEIIAERAQTVIFSLYEKINRVNLTLSMISSTSALRIGQKMLYVDPDGKKYTTAVIDSNEKELIIASPKDKTGDEITLQELSKINLMVQGKNEIAFSISVRVVRYQIQQGEPAVVVTHAKQFEPFLKHEYVYIQGRIPCQLQAAITKPDIKRGDSVLYNGEGRTYNGILLNYSGTSCNIVVKNPMKVHELLLVKSKLNGNDIDEMIVMIMNVVTNEETHAFLLHANFVKLAAKTKNYILSHVYSFAT